MVAPPLALAGRADLAVLQFDGHRRRLFDEASERYAAAAPGRPHHWATGNGWVVAGVARALHPVPDWPDGEWDRLAAHARTVFDACLAPRRPDGLFHDVLDDPATFRETNSAQMPAYAALTGAADGWLPPSYAAIGRDLLAATRKVDELGFVTGACGSPGFAHPGTSAEAQAFHLLASAASAR
jgi:unsaturated rhamnogalacturonyl hydrolase